MHITAVIVLVPQHLRFLAPLLRELDGAEPGYTEVIVVASGFGRKFLQVQSILREKYSGEARVVGQPLQSAGANRNVGLLEASTEFVCFLDADDTYSRDRNMAIQGLNTLYQFDLMLHGFEPFTDGVDTPPSLQLPPKYLEVPYFTEKDVHEGTLESSMRNRAGELTGSTATTNLVFTDPRQVLEVHHAHSIVRRESVGTIRFHEVFGVRNEDGVFARDMLEAGKKILLSPLVLSGYRQGARAKPAQNRLWSRSLKAIKWRR